MDRVAVFVDAGYLLQEGGFACHGTRKRVEIDCDYRGLTEELDRLAGDSSGLPLLRIYWYDAARPGAPGFKDHQAVARLPNVKLRLGRLVQRQRRLEQKGVDALIIRDLMTLARERAVATAFVVGGDEDIREGIVSAQDMGVRVIVVGVGHEERNQSELLVHESDEHLLLTRETLAPFFRQAVLPSTIASPEAKVEQIARQVGRDYARSCAESMSRTQLSVLLTEYPRIPPELDATLLREADRAVGSTRDRFDLKVELRGGFWEGLSVAIAGEDAGVEPDD